MVSTWQGNVVRGMSYVYILIKDREKEEEEASLGSLQMLGALQVMTKANSLGSEAGKQTKVASSSKGMVIKGKGHSIGKKGRCSRP